MKVGVIKAGARIAFGAGDTSGANGEARSLCNMLVKGGADVHIFTKILAKDILKPEFRWHDLEKSHKSINDFGLDCLVMINSAPNFFGGAEDTSIMANYHILNNFSGPVFYIFCDPNLTLKQIWNSVEKKEWGSKYNRNDIEITRKDINVISQSYNLDFVRQAFNKTGIEFGSFTQFPFEKFPLMFQTDTSPVEKEFDLSYGGTMRSGRREKNLVKYYFGLPGDISVELFGKIKLEDFKPKNVDRYVEMANSNPDQTPLPTFNPPVKYDDMIRKMQKTLSHVVIGDEVYEDFGMLNQRIYESILANCVTFIDLRLDYDKRVYGHSPFAEFLYVEDKNDVIGRIRYLKSSASFVEDILNFQRETSSLDIDKYCHDFVNLLEV